MIRSILIIAAAAITGGDATQASPRKHWHPLQKHTSVGAYGPTESLPTWMPWSQKHLAVAHPGHIAIIGATGSVLTNDIISSGTDTPSISGEDGGLLEPTEITGASAAEMEDTNLTNHSNTTVANLTTHANSSVNKIVFTTTTTTTGRTTEKPPPLEEVVDGYEREMSHHEQEEWILQFTLTCRFKLNSWANGTIQKLFSTDVDLRDDPSPFEIIAYPPADATTTITTRTTVTTTTTTLNITYLNANPIPGIWDPGLDVSSNRSNLSEHRSNHTLDNRSNLSDSDHRSNISSNRSNGSSSTSADHLWLHHNSSNVSSSVNGSSAIEITKVVGMTAAVADFTTSDSSTADEIHHDRATPGKLVARVQVAEGLQSGSDGRGLCMLVENCDLTQELTLGEWHELEFIKTSRSVELIIDHIKVVKRTMATMATDGTLELKSAHKILGGKHAGPIFDGEVANVQLFVGSVVPGSTTTKAHSSTTTTMTTTTTTTTETMTTAATATTVTSNSATVTTGTATTSVSATIAPNVTAVDTTTAVNTSRGAPNTSTITSMASTTGSVSTGMIAATTATTTATSSSTPSNSSHNSSHNASHNASLIGLHTAVMRREVPARK